jgi:hypothetical protein
VLLPREGEVDRRDQGRHACGLILDRDAFGVYIFGISNQAFAKFNGGLRSDRDGIGGKSDPKFSPQAQGKERRLLVCQFAEIAARLVVKMAPTQSTN